MSQSFLRLDLMMQQGYMRTFKIEPNGAAAKIAPDSRKNWLILHGMIKHKSGKNSVITIKSQVGEGDVQGVCVLAHIDSGVTDRTFPLFQHHTAIDAAGDLWPFDRASQMSLFILTDKEELWMNGSNGSNLVFTVIEWFNTPA